MRVSLYAIVLVGFLGIPATASVQIQIVALTGDVAPGAGGARFNTFEAPEINQSGEVAFGATLLVEPGGATLNDDTGIWGPDGQGSLKLVVREGDVAPGAGVARFDNLTHASFTLQDDVAFAAPLIVEPGGATTDDNRAIWKPDGAGGHELIARRGQDAPGADGADFDTFIGPFQLPSGDVVLGGWLQVEPGGAASDTDEAYWGPDGTGGLELIAREGSDAPGAGGADFGTGFYIFPWVRNDGALVFSNRLQVEAGGATASDDFGIWGPDALGNLALVAREPEQAPGTSDWFFGFRGGRISSFGIVFGADLVDSPGGTNLVGTGIWRRQGVGVLSLIVRDGVAAPGAPGEVFYSFSDLTMNANGDLVFVGTLDNLSADQDNGIWRKNNNQPLTLLAREGSQAPGASARFQFPSSGNIVPRPTMNNNGDVAFTAGLVQEPGGADSTNNNGVWATVGDELVLIVRKGDVVDVDPDPGVQDNRTISAIAFNGIAGGDDAFPHSLNDAGRLTFKLTFVDGSSGIFTARAVGECTADVNEDGLVNITDLGVVLANFGTTSGATLADGDVTGDGAVNISDLGLLLTGFGQDCS